LPYVNGRTAGQHINSSTAGNGENLAASPGRRPKFYVDESISGGITTREKYQKLIQLLLFTLSEPIAAFIGVGIKLHKRPTA
jgi:hypothetical protein